jgi:hypothetical protein
MPGRSFQWRDPDFVFIYFGIFHSKGPSSGTFYLYVIGSEAFDFRSVRATNDSECVLIHINRYCYENLQIGGLQFKGHPGEGISKSGLKEQKLGPLNGP